MSPKFCGIRINKGTHYALQEADIVKLIKLFRFRRYGRIERKNMERMPKQMVAARVDGIRQMGRTWERWIDEV
jgi:hypothetical protein